MSCLGKSYDGSHILSIFHQLNVKCMFYFTQNEPAQMCLSCGLKLKLCLLKFKELLLRRLKHT